MKPLALFIPIFFRSHLSGFDLACFAAIYLLTKYLAGTWLWFNVATLVAALTVVWLFVSIWVEYLACQFLAHLKDKQ